MSSSDPRSWLDRAINAALGLLVVAAAVFVAVHLIMTVWVSLVVILGIAAMLGIAIGVLRARNRHW